MSKRNNPQLVSDIIEAAGRIQSYTEGMTFEDFCSDSKTMDAVIRNFEIIGEAANRLTDDFKDNYDKIEWHKIRGFRNRIVHDYVDIDYEIVWQLKITYLPILISQLSDIAM